MAETPRPPESGTPDSPEDTGGAAPRDELADAGRPAAQDPVARARARGRRIATVVFYLFSGVVAVLAGSQVVVQAFERRETSEVQPKSCDEGLSRLVAAIERARAAGSSTDGEDAALDDFRKALRPDWDDRDHIEDLCRPSPTSMAALDAIEQLRYAEEHAVRREAAELAPLRRRVQAIAPRDTGAAPAAPKAPVGPAR